VPYALQHVSLHSSWSLKSNRRMMAQVQDMSRKARQAEPPAG